MRNLINVLLLAAVTGAMSFGQTKESRARITLSSVHPAARPLTVRYEERLAAPGKAPAVGSRRIFAIRGDLSTVTESFVYFLNGSGVSSHTREIGFANGDRVRIDERLSLVTAVRTPVVFSEELPQLTARSDCSEDFLGNRQHAFADRNEKILGFRVVSETKEYGERRITSWVSPELGCVELRRRAEFLDSSGRVTDTSEQVAVSATPGEPEARLFSVPLHYEHVSYSTQMARAAQAAGRTASEAGVAALRQQDEVWEKHRIADLSTAGKTPRQIVKQLK